MALESGAAQVVRVNVPDELPTDLTGTVCVTAGASVPEEVVSAVIAHLAPAQGVEEIRITEEDEYFPPPRELRDLLAAVDVLATFSLGASVADRPTLLDRHPNASDVLHALDRKSVV